MAVTKIKPIKSMLGKALDYIQNPYKTDGKTIVSSFGCSYETADIEFEYAYNWKYIEKRTGYSADRHCIRCVANFLTFQIIMHIGIIISMPGD